MIFKVVNLYGILLFFLLFLGWRYGKLFMVLIVYFYFASISVFFNISDCKFSGASVYFMNWFCTAYFHAIIEVSPPVWTRIKKFAQILGMCFNNVFVFLFWVPSFLMLFFIHCSASVSLCFLFGFLCFKVSWHAYDDISVCPDLYYSFYKKWMMILNFVEVLEWVNMPNFTHASSFRCCRWGKAIFLTFVNLTSLSHDFLSAVDLVICDCWLCGFCFVDLSLTRGGPRELIDFWGAVLP
jgi:hypothetical protein